MQDPNTITSKSRKPWYKKAIEMATLWKTIFKAPSRNGSLWKTLNTTEAQSTASNLNRQKLRRCTSLKVATSFTRVCLCAPISSYTEVFNTDTPPRRSYSYPRSSNYSKPLTTTTNSTTLQGIRERVPSARLRLSVEGRRVFRGKSLKEDVLMRRFVVEEEAMMQVRRRNEMEIIRKRASLRRRKLGPSPLSKMVIGEDLDLSYC
ncbi:hypothetical protein V2J09_011339 [Rumex salicifolius]